MFIGLKKVYIWTRNKTITKQTKKQRKTICFICIFYSALNILWCWGGIRAFCQKLWHTVSRKWRMDKKTVTLYDPTSVVCKQEEAKMSFKSSFRSDLQYSFQSTVISSKPRQKVKGDVAMFSHRTDFTEQKPRLHVCSFLSL